MPPNPKGVQAREELHRAIRALSSDYQLHLQIPDPTLSPSKRRQQRRTSEQERADAIYSRAQFLQFKDPRHLSTSIGRFREQADQLLREWTSNKRNASSAAANNADAAPTTLDSFDPLRARPTLEERAVLQTLLLDLLRPRDANAARTKRPSPESDPNQKRSKVRLQQDGEHHADGQIVVDSVDDIPVRTSALNTSVATSFGQSRTSSFLSRSTSSSRLSFASTVFSTAVDNDGSSSQFTIESTPRKPAKYLSSALNDSFAQHDTQPLISGTSELHQARVESQTTPYSSVPEMVGMSTPVADTRFTQAVAPASAASTALNDRLSHIWPKFPLRGLNHAPFIVIWEITRAAIHCGVDLAEWDLDYNTTWHDQTKFRGRLASHPLFVGKGLPPSCDASSWAAGLSSFTAHDKTVTLSAELVYSPQETGPFFHLKLQPPRLELGHRLGRRFGADRFMEVILPSPTSEREVPLLVKQDENGPEQIIKWLAGDPHYFVGRTWVPFFTRDARKTVKDPQPTHLNKTRNVLQERVYFFAIDGNTFRLPEANAQFPPPQEASTLSARTKMRRYDLLNWAVSIQNNAHQPVPKLFSRLALSLSRTCPTIVLRQNQIFNRSKDLGRKQVMNDGIGRMSRSFARKVAAHLGLSEIPCCYQARIGSAKGMWIIDVEDDGLGDNDWIETYPSQRKWKCDFQDIHHRTFEVRNWSRELRTASLNQQFIPVLEAQSRFPGAIRKAIARHLVDGLREEIDGQIAAMKHPMDLRAWVRRSGNSMTGLSQAHVPFVGGLPDRDEDIIPFLLDAGFETGKNEYLKELTWAMRKRQMDQLKAKMNIKIPRSTYAYMVVDFTGALEEGEVQLAFSSKFEAGTESETLLDGIEILVARAPAHFVSDIQKVKAVFKPSLKWLKDVIVFSSKGDSPLADLLSGGDYDGDQAWVCWDPDIVQNFTNSPIPPQPDLVGLGYLRKFNPTFQSVISTSENIDDACAEFLHSAMSFSMQPSLLGICTSFKEKLCYFENSVSSERAVALSTLVGLLVDQSKQGLLFSEDDFRRLKSKMEMKSKEPEYKKERGSIRRNRIVHILDFLRFDVANVVVEQSLEEFYKTISKQTVTRWDKDLTRLADEFEGQNSRTYEKLMADLRPKIEAIEAKWRASMKVESGSSDFNAKVKEIHDDWVSIQPPDELLTSRTIRGLLDAWNGDPATSKWTLLKASYTFKLCYRNCYNMVWRIAGHQLAWMKAMSSRGSADVSAVAVTAQMWNVLRPDTRRITALAARRDDESLAAIEEISVYDDNGTLLDDS
ncbi:hypothetical protein AK830_g8376 [Neonectria ditissima]|uniref:RNA-dependent RNA polymerase n=1 Tax=Neonectria ditissima TaxID=78410 RepID=A0A0P7AKM3_9HYPO|nr:hypothetical protein AK830_g8376 [Neonectria ditissima]